MTKRGRPPYPYLLTPRESEVLALIKEGLGDRQIAERLGITLRTAKFHVSEILSKLGVGSRRQAALWPEVSPRLWSIPPVAWLMRVLRPLATSVIAKITAGAAALLLSGALVLLAIVALSDGEPEEISIAAAIPTRTPRPTPIATTTATPTPEPTAQPTTTALPTPMPTPPPPTGELPFISVAEGGLSSSYFDDGSHSSPSLEHVTTQEAWEAFWAFRGNIPTSQPPLVNLDDDMVIAVAIGGSSSYKATTQKVVSTGTLLIIYAAESTRVTVARYLMTNVTRSTRCVSQGLTCNHSLSFR